MTRERTSGLSRRRVLQAVGIGGLVGGISGAVDPVGSRAADASGAGTDGQVAGRIGEERRRYDWEAATTDVYWYSRQNAESAVLGEGGVRYPRSQSRRAEFDDLIDEMRDVADLDERPIRGLRSFTIAPFAEVDPAYVQRPVFNPRPVQSTLIWAEPTQSRVTPGSFAWTCLAYAQTSVAFEEIGDPATDSDDVADFYAQLYGQTAQRAIEYAFLDEEVLRDERREDEEGEGELYLLLSYDAQNGGTTRGSSEDDRPRDYAATLWTLSMLVEFADSAFGYDNPAPEVEIEDVEELADMAARTVTDEISGGEIFQKEGVRGIGTMLSALGWYGAQGGDSDAVDDAEEYADSLVGFVFDNLDSDGRVGPSDESVNQAAVQGAVGQGLVWAEEGLGVDADDAADDVLDYLIDDAWNPSSGTFDDERGNRTIEVTVRDLGDVIGGLNAAGDVLDREEVEDVFPEFVNNTVNRGRLQRAERSLSRRPEADFPLPLPGNAGGQFGSAPVFNATVTYDRPTDEWTVDDRSFDAENAMYATCQCAWIGEIEGDGFPDRGLP